MSEQRALVIGASGQVGRAVTHALAIRGWNVTGTANTRHGEGRFHLDLGDETSVRKAVLETCPRLCVLAAGMTHVDGCETDPARAFAINAAAPAVCAEACRAVGAQVVFLSTEYVFDGTAGPYGEDDAPRPISVYGASKLEGERRVLAAHPTNLSVRTTVVYSWHMGDKNFVMQVAERLTAGDRMRVPSDQRSSPTYAPDLGEAIACLAGKAHGVLNVVGPDVLGRFAFAQRVARALGLNETLLECAVTADLHQLAPRPLHAGLKVARLRALGLETRGISAGLAAVAAARGLASTHRL